MLQPGQNLTSEVREKALSVIADAYEHGERLTAEQLGDKLGISKTAVYRLKKELGLTGLPNQNQIVRLLTCEHGKRKKECRVCYLDRCIAARQAARESERVQLHWPANDKH